MSIEELNNFNEFYFKGWSENDKKELFNTPYEMEILENGLIMDDEGSFIYYYDLKSNGLSSEEKLGVAYANEDQMVEKSINNQMYSSIEREYVLELRKSQEILLQQKKYTPVLIAAGFYECFSWLGFFIDLTNDYSLQYIGEKLEERFVRENEIDKEKARNNLKLSYDAIQKVLFKKVDDIVLQEKPEIVYANYLSALLASKSNREVAEELNCLIDIIRQELTIRKEMFQEIVAFNETAKGKKFSYEGFKIKMEQIKPVLNKKERIIPKHFSDIWKVTKDEMYNELDYFILNNPDKYLEKTSVGYNYIVSYKNNIRLAGLIIAFYKAGWIHSHYLTMTAPTYKVILDDFFNINITDSTPFTPGRITNLLDETHADFKEHVAHLLPFIQRRNRI